MQDSLEEGPLFKTRAGRHVYGGGGIKPDTTIESESIVVNANKMYQLIHKGVLVDVASWYVNRHGLMEASFDSFQTAFQFSPAIIEKIEETCRQKEVELIREDILKDERFLSNRLKAEIARSVWGAMTYWQVILEEDNQFQQALGLFPEVVKLSELAQTRAPKFD
jgi:carboxyl-terminal processing protease